MKTYTITITEAPDSAPRTNAEIIEPRPPIQRYMRSVDREDIEPVIDCINAGLKAKARAPRSDKGHRRAAAE